ncbi:MAG: 4-hydroxythreonine-4-phosphate dehydrogenase PdxA [Rhizobiales bacterium]|nr:4-hydroxythreonine-4-phosphate dehydrogenase PdxA [Hyphomicrobiales bacterium]
MGEPGGIGPDITLAVWLRRNEIAIPPFYLLADPAFVAERAAELGLDCPITVVDPRNAGAVFQDALPVSPLKATVSAEPGVADPGNATAVVEAIARAVGDVRAGMAAAVVTNPINKQALYTAGFRHPGHTEFLGTLSAAWTGFAARPVMMLAGPDLRAVPVTIHVPLRDVAGLLTTELIVETGRIVAYDLRRRFGLPYPRLAIAGLNPHAGEGGALGSEDVAVIAPAVAALRADGIQVAGPLSADAMFHRAARSGYDAALCMYHDQALIPAKTLAFSDTVNVTLGLAFVRTSPDHGTAFDLAGTGRADPSSLAAALRLAAELVANERAA